MITNWKEEPKAGVTFPEGFSAAGVRAGIKSLGNDMALLVCESIATVAGTFTTNQVKAACVRYSQRVVKSGTARAVIVNAGNANACNGEQGDRDNRAMAEAVGSQLNILPDQVVTASTGIIGHLMPMEKIEFGVSLAVDQLDRGIETDLSATEAIMTTDTYPKYRAVTVDADTWVAPIRFGGMCKGSGMIAPNMATMLAFITTDAQLPADLLQEAIRRAVAVSYNSVTVDGDTSTNDMCILLASGMGGASISVAGEAFEDFVAALSRFCIGLAKEIARDGEGATKLVQVVVKGVPSSEEAHQIAKTIAESPLVKTALYGNDPNWGRLLMAAGRAGVAFDADKIDAFIGAFQVCGEGRSISFDRDGAHDYLKQSKEVEVSLDLHAGDATATVWTCDYSYDYVKINAEYHT